MPLGSEHRDWFDKHPDKGLAAAVAAVLESAAAAFQQTLAGPVALTGKPQGTQLEGLNKLAGVPLAKAGPQTPARARGAQGPREKTEGRGELIGNKGVLVFDFAPGKAALTPNQERVLMSQQVKFSTRGARLRIVGHSSSEEEPSVSQKRADAVATFLRADPKHPVPDENILETKGVGAKRPIAPEGDKGKVNEANRKRNRSVEVVMTTAGEFLGGGDVNVDANEVGKDAPAAPHEEGSDEEIEEGIGNVIAEAVLEGADASPLVAIVETLKMLAHIAGDWQKAGAMQQRHAYADGVRNCADAARNFIAKRHASVAYGDVESAAMPKIDDMTYYPAEAWEAKRAASMGIKAAVDAFNPAMRRTEAFVRKRLGAKGLKDPQLQKVYDKIIGDMRSKVAYALADALKAKAGEIRRG